MIKYENLFLEPFYEYVDEHIDDQQAILYFLRRYKHRCEWFHADRLRQAVEDDTQRGEKGLASDLYEYLHNQGIDIHIEPRSASGIPDFVADQVGKDRVIADTKLFWIERSKGKPYIISAFNQAYTYARDYNEPCAYLVIFKMSSEELNFLVPSSQSMFPCMSLNNKTVNSHDRTFTGKSNGIMGCRTPHPRLSSSLSARSKERYPGARNRASTGASPCPPKPRDKMVSVPR